MQIILLYYYLISLDIPPCSSNPCQNGGQCMEVNPTKYYCDCTNTYYTGPNCEIGYVDVPDLPFININSLYSFVISARPQSSIQVNIATSSPSLGLSDSIITFNSSYQSHTLRVSSPTAGIYSISFTLSGPAASGYQTPDPVLLVIKDPTSTHTTNQYFTTVSQPVGQLSSGCCSPGGQIYQCPFSTNTVTFKSTCSWDFENDDGAHETRGIVFASGSGISLPFSIAGVELKINGNDITFALPDDAGSCADCIGSDSSCYHYSPGPDDIVDLMQANSIAKTYLTQAADLLPTWISFSVGDLNITNQMFSIADYTAYISTGANAYLIPGCSSLDLDSDGLYSIYNYREEITMSLDGQTKSYDSNAPVCFAINLCAGADSPVHITIPDGVESQLLTLSQFQVCAL